MAARKITTALAIMNTATWSHRYLINTEYWDGSGELANGCKGPILLYTGNEGSIDGFWSANGFMTDYLAPKWGAMLLFPEERYYGESMPFGDDSFEPENLVYLSTEQVLEDYVELVTYLKSTLPGATNCPVVAFGGSYGGTLTTFLRTAYPHVVVGGLASSAPVGYYDTEGWKAAGVDEYTWSDIVTTVYNDADPACVDTITAASAAIESAAADEAGRDMLVELFNVCEFAGLGPDGQPAALFQYALESLPQLDYPVALGDLPAWPVNVSCALLVGAGADDTDALLTAAASITRAAMGSTDPYTCMETLGEGPGNIPGDGPGPGNWGYQSCTETLHEFSARGIRDFKFDFETAAAYCAEIFDGVRPNPSALATRFGGYAIPSTSTNLIFSNGGLDPWHGGGFYEHSSPLKTDPSNTYIWMARGAHHLDLRGPNEADPEEVTAARQLEEKIIRSWIDDASGGPAGETMDPSWLHDVGRRPHSVTWPLL